MAKLRRVLPERTKRTVRALARRLHPHVPSVVARLLERAVPSIRRPAAAQQTPSTEPQATEPQPTTAPPPAVEVPTVGEILDITPEVVGTTYAPDAVLPMLAIENTMLRKRLLATTPDDHVVPESARAQARRAVEAYLAGRTAPGGRVRHLVISNTYPDEGQEYNNAFVHRRVKRYQQAGANVDVVLAGYSVTDRIYEFDGVRVLSGQGPEIAELLQRASYDSISVHFLNRLMWDNMKPHLERQRVHVFLHGYECSRWVRRIGNYSNGTKLERAINGTFELQRLWDEVVSHPHGPASYIFVSDWWRRAVTDDMGVTFPPRRTHVIHNVIDPDVFSYQPKPPEQRFNLLWVRSTAQLNYGHDIAIDVIQRLSQTSHWEKAKVTIIGDGQHFGDFFSALAGFANVTIRQGFVMQEELARLHRAHGIFLVPSRLDTQGVSRDEAMSSGLVVATNLVTAIPEFVDAETGIVAEAERADQLAEGILRVWEDPELFTRLSRAGAERVQAQCGPHATVEREMSLLGIIAGEEV